MNARIIIAILRARANLKTGRLTEGQRKFWEPIVAKLYREGEKGEAWDNRRKALSER